MTYGRASQKSELPPINTNLIGYFNYVTFTLRTYPGDSSKTGFQLKSVSGPQLSIQSSRQITIVICNLGNSCIFGYWVYSSDTQKIAGKETEIVSTRLACFTRQFWPPSSSLLSSWESAIMKQVEQKDAIGARLASNYSPLHPDVAAVQECFNWPENLLLFQVFLKP